MLAICWWFPETLYPFRSTGSCQRQLPFIEPKFKLREHAQPGDQSGRPLWHPRPDFTGVPSASLAPSFRWPGSHFPRFSRGLPPLGAGTFCRSTRGRWHQCFLGHREGGAGPEVSLLLPRGRAENRVPHFIFLFIRSFTQKIP